MTIESLSALSNGAKFYRADMHIHSFGASHDVKDATMTAEAIVASAIAENLNIIAITDHNEINNVEPAMKAAVGTGLLVIPGIELSTPQGHLLCYLPDVDSLQKFFGRITVVDRDKPNSRCQNAILDCLNLLETLNGFAVLAHVDAGSGFETENPGNSPHKFDILCHKCLLGIELKSALSDISYSLEDPDPNRVQFGNERIKRLGLGSSQYLARVLNSDAHTLNALGRNASGVKKVTRIKMDTPSFNSFRIALEDSDARIRIEDQIPATIPSIAFAVLQGGFLDGHKIHFSPNLNCIIGGRGTGKSTTFEVIKCLTGKKSDNQVVDSEIWPQNISLYWHDQAGQYHEMTRPLGGSLANVTAADGPISFQIECYGQGETERISKDAQNNPIALLSYLDRFIDITSLKSDEDNARNELLTIQTEIEKATTNVNLIPQYERSLVVTQQQLAALEKAKAKEVIELSRQLAHEREIRVSISQKVTGIKQSIDGLSTKTVIDEIENLADPANLTIGGDEFKNIVTHSREFETEATTAQTATKTEFTKLENSVNQDIAAWKTKEAEAVKVIDAKKKELSDQNIPLDLLYIQKLAQEEAQTKANLTTLRLWQPHLVLQKKLYKDAAAKRWNAREKIAMTRGAYAKEASATLKSVLTDLIVTLKFLKSAYSPTADELIKQSLGWRTHQVSRANMLISQLTLPGLIQAVDAKDSTTIMKVLTKEKTPVFDKSEADRIIAMLSEPQTRFALERCEVYDLPQLIVTKATPDALGTPVYAKRDFSKLSLGQQQSVLLALLLSSKSNSPLIIDQPEDNLDGEFIYHSLVPVLRLAKERRQIIIVTHNANIAVLGDAEQIIILKSTNDKCSIVSNGSIDHETTRDIACNILEGAKEAFQRRAKIYGTV
jgi:ABC-type lipoprotein export system ATPase subunit